MRQSRLHLSRSLAVVLAVALTAQAPLARAEIVDTETLATTTTTNQTDAERAKIQAFLDRSSARERLEAMGLSGVVAKERVAALSEAEVHALARRIDAMPAGGNLSNQDLVIILLVAILVAIAL